MAFVTPASIMGAEGATVPPGGNVKVGIGTLVCSGMGGSVPMVTGNVPGNGILTPPVRKEDTSVKLHLNCNKKILYTALNSSSLIFALWRSETYPPSLELIT